MDVLCGLDGSLEARDALAQLRASFAFGGDVTVELLPGAPDSAAELAARAEESGPALLVIGAHAHDRIAMRAALEGHASVLVAASPRPIRRVVVATDGSREAQRAVELVGSLPFRRAPDVVVVSVVDAPDPPDRLTPESAIVAQAIAAEAAETIRPAAASVEIRTPVGAPAEQIAVVAAEIDADLIVLGTRGLSAQQRRRVGSVAQALLERLPTSLLIARAEAA